MSDRTIRIITCGHVDDGKSTLLGRLLFEMDVLPTDQIEAATENGVLDYSRLTDGLEDERTQGITIDVAYRYVRNGERYYRFADCPGHLQYLRNMAVAAPDGDIAILLVDASHGIREQTLRHAKIAAFFGIKDFVLAINKMDKISYSQETYNEIEKGFRQNMKDFTSLNITAIPLSAIAGDNISSKSENTPWYKGKTLADYIADYSPRELSYDLPILAVQNVIRITPEERGYQGTLRGGKISVGDKLKTSDTHQIMMVQKIYHSSKEVQTANPNEAITIVIDIDVDLARGAVLYADKAIHHHSDYMEGGLVILDERYNEHDELAGLLKVGHKEVSSQIEIKRIDGPIKYSEIYTSMPVSYQGFTKIPELGLFILIEQGSEKVIAVGQFFDKDTLAGNMYSI